MQPASSSQCLAATQCPKWHLEAVSVLSRVLQYERWSTGWQLDGRVQEQVFGDVLEPDEDGAARYGLIGGVIAREMR
jgi:hypothetical protein